MILKHSFFILLLLFSNILWAAQDKAPAIQGDYAAKKITDHVYVIHGPRGFPNKENQGFMNNPAFVITTAGVVVIDPGSSVQVGEMVLNKITKVTKSPVIAAFNTHVHGDHWLGNQAIKAAYPTAIIYAHPKMIAKAKAGEGASWVNIMNNMTKGASQGTKWVAPDKGVNHGDTRKIGNMSFHILHNDKAHTDNDIMIEVIEEKVIFLGDNVTNKMLTRMDDGNIKGQIAAIDLALKTNNKYFVPGHGETGGTEVAKVYQTFLKKFYASVKKYYQQGKSDFEMKASVIEDLAEFKSWSRFDDDVGRGISMVYLQVEEELF